MSSNGVCPHCGAPRPLIGDACPKCDEPFPTRLVSALPTALIVSPNAEAPHLPTTMMESPNAEPPQAPTILQNPANPPMDVLPTAMNMAPDVLAPLPNRQPSKLTVDRVPVPTPRSAPLPAVASQDAVRTLNARPQVAAPPPEPDGLPTNEVLAPFPVPGPSTSPAPTDTQDEDTKDTGRVVAPYRKAKADADTGKVEVPFRAVEAPFAVEEKDDTRPMRPSAPATPMAVSKRRKGTTQPFDEVPAGPVAVAAPFPVGHTPPRPKAQPPEAPKSRRGSGLLIAAFIVLTSVGASATLLYLSSGRKGGPREGMVRDASAQHKAKPGHLRVGTLCGGKPIVSRLSVAGVDKGDTPVEVALPTGLPAGEHLLELHIAGRFGDPVDVHYNYRLPLPAGAPGEAIEIELAGCMPQAWGK
ncbi:MAG: hypothetical protein JNK82_20690 [Myxococcaceae bacterium]|nr:hypothetical protein [Myxococcaceae bacterium]